MRRIILIGLLVFSQSQLSAQCGGLAAGNNSGNKTITGACNITGNVVITSGTLTIGSGASLTISGSFDNDGNHTITINGGSMDVGTNFRNDGNGTVTVTGGGSLDVGGYYYNDGNGTTNFLNGTISITGNFTNDGNGTIDSDGTVSIGGDFSNTGNGDLSISGGLNVEGDVSSSGNGSIIIENGGVLAADDISVSGGTIEVEGGATIYSETGNITGTVNNDPSNTDQVCSNNCCGAACNSSGNSLSPEAQETLPVTLLYFKAQSEKLAVKLTWSTATESNTSHFEVYKSVGDAYYLIAEVSASGNSKSQKHYSATDYAPSSGANVYQLVSVDYDGYKEVFRAHLTNYEAKGIVVYPNPSDGLEIYLSKPAGLETPEVFIYSLNGHLVFTGRLEEYQSKIQFSTPLPKGIYLLRLAEGSQTHTTRISVR